MINKYIYIIDMIYIYIYRLYCILACSPSQQQSPPGILLPKKPLPPMLSFFRSKKTLVLIVLSGENLSERESQKDESDIYIYNSRG